MGPTVDGKRGKDDGSLTSNRTSSKRNTSKESSGEMRQQHENRRGGGLDASAELHLRKIYKTKNGVKVSVNH